MFCQHNNIDGKSHETGLSHQNFLEVEHNYCKKDKLGEEIDYISLKKGVSSEKLTKQKQNKQKITPISNDHNYSLQEKAKAYEKKAKT